MDETTPRETDTSQEPPRRSDGQQTHTSILDTAMRLAFIDGLGSLTIGRLAKELDISKSGVFAHFGSKERLQQETINAAEEIFEREVFAPCMTEPEGRPRLEALCETYLSYVERNVFPGGCFFAQLLGEYDAQSGPIHDRVEEGQRGFVGILEGLMKPPSSGASSTPPQTLPRWRSSYMPHSNSPTFFRRSTETNPSSTEPEMQ